jgi:pimeloyl-ACP methyl ester carboxylesterase
VSAVVLVHGLYHRPGHFSPVADRLRATGAHVVVPELHRGSLAADTAAVQAAVDALDEPPVVLGHSYGGSVITGLRGALHLVYLAAFVLDTGESAASLGGASRLLRDAVVPDTAGATRVLPERAGEVFYGDCPAGPATWATGLLRPQGPGCGRGVARHHAWKAPPATYVVCARDKAIDPALQRALAGRCGSVREWECGHSPFVGRPGRVAALLREVAGTTPTRSNSDSAGFTVV